jgi:hypothetical protein
MTTSLAAAGPKTPLIPPSTHPYAEVIHRLEAGGSMLPDTPENLQQIIGIYKAYAVPMDFYWRDLLYIAERVLLNPDCGFATFADNPIAGARLATAHLATIAAAARALRARHGVA